MKHWIARGIGPFYIKKSFSPPCEIYGESATVDISAAFVFSGDQQIKVIRQHNDVPTILLSLRHLASSDGRLRWSINSRRRDYLASLPVILQNADNGPDGCIYRPPAEFNSIKM